MSQPAGRALDDMRHARTGTNLGITLYAQFGDQPTTADPYLGVFNDQGLATFAATAINTGLVPMDAPWISVGRLVYAEPCVSGIDDFIAVMVSPAVARWLANRVASAQPPPSQDPPA